MKKRLLKFSIGCAALLALTVAVSLFLNREPEHQGRPLSAWMADLKSKSPAERKAATEAVQAMGPEAAKYLARELGRGPGVLQKLNGATGGIVPEKVKAGLRRIFNRGGDVTSKYEAANALKLMGTNGAAAIPALATTLTGDNVVLSSASSIALAEMGPPAVPPLVEALKSPNLTVRGAACMALGRLGTNAAPAVPALVEIVRNEVGPIVPKAAYCISQIGAPAVPRLKPLLSHTNSAVRRWALYSIEHMRPPLPDAYGDVIPLLADPQPEVRATALGALRQLEWHSPRLWNAALFALEDPHTNVQARALRVLANSPGTVVSNLNTCVKFLDSHAPSVRAQALDTIASAGPRASHAIPRVARLMSDPDRAIRQKAAEVHKCLSESKKIVESGQSGSR